MFNEVREYCSSMGCDSRLILVRKGGLFPRLILVRLFAQGHPHDSLDDVLSYAAYVKLPTWMNNGAVLLGDAAHATFGVGVTLAVEGAYQLAGELSKIENSDGIPAALKLWEGNHYVNSTRFAASISTYYAVASRACSSLVTDIIQSILSTLCLV